MFGFLPTARRWLRWLGITVMLSLAIATGAFGVLQTPVGREWLGSVLADALGKPGLFIAIDGLVGLVPFRVQARNITIADDRGVWLALKNVGFDLSASELLAGRALVRALTAEAVDIARLPQMPVGPDVPLSDRLRLPALPIPLVISRLEIDRLTLEPAILGERIDAELLGSAALQRDTQLMLDLHRVDGRPGNLTLQLSVSGTTPVLSLRLLADEPTGALLGQVLHRADRPALSLALTGEGPLSAWHGRLETSAGSLARFEAEISFSGLSERTVTLAGVAAFAGLLPPEIVPLIGERVPLAARATLTQSGALALENLSVQLASGSLTGDGILAGPDRAVAAHLQAHLPKLAAANDVLGRRLEGSVELDARITGTEQRPRLDLDISGESISAAAFGARHAEAHVTMSSTADVGDPSARIELAAQGRLRAVMLSERGMMIPADTDLGWSLAARAAPNGSAVELARLALQGAGLDLAGSGTFDQVRHDLNGHLRLSVADLQPFSGLVGRPVEGALTIEATARQQPPGHIIVDVDGSVTGLQTGSRTIDALSGRVLTISGSGQRDPAGMIVLDHLAISGSNTSIQASGRFDPNTRDLAARLDAEIPKLQPLGAALNTAMAGRLIAQISADGSLDRPLFHARIEGDDLAAGAAKLDRFRLDADLADLAQPHATLTGEFRGGGLDGSLALKAEGGGRAELVISQLQMRAADSVLKGDFRIDLERLLAQGILHAEAPDLARWSSLIGMPLEGSIDLKARLTTQGEQTLDLTLTGERLASGSGASRVAVSHIVTTARLTDLLGAPGGKAVSSLTGVSFPSGGLDRLTIKLGGLRPGRFNFAVETEGKVSVPLALAIGGEFDIKPYGGDVDLRLARLTGYLGADRVQLTRLLRVSKRGGDLTVSDLALTIGPGQIAGNFARRGQALSLRLVAGGLSIAPLARLAGYSDIGGTVSLDADVAGTIGAPQGSFTLSGRGLRLALAKQSRPPSLGLEFGGRWNGRELALNGRISGLKGETIGIVGSVPFVLSPTPLGITVPPQGRLAMRLQGAGELANLADLLPLGEDRFSGRFGLDASITGTVSAPAFSGHLTIAEGRYENFATGMVLTKIRVDLAGDRDRLTLRDFAAEDTANGSLRAQGGIVLSGTSSISKLAVSLTHFRIAARDEAVVTASGTLAIAGAIASPSVTGELTAERGDVTIPDNLPSSVTRLEVIEIAGRGSKPPSKEPEPPALPATLDIQMAIPGKVFVRGRGLDSEWSGRLKITGAATAPQIVGSLDVVRGTFDILGKSFKITRGRINFGGRRSIDPALDILAEVSGGDVTAQVLVGGLASAPALTLSSTPALPQDEILARVLFNRGVGQITAAQGVQVAQAAATLAGGGPGVLDRLRGRIGLDRLVFGSAPAGNASSNLNPAAAGNANSPAVSGGKYVAEGVYVGATQGLTPQSSKVTVEIEVRPRVTVETDLSQTGGSGIGLNYKYDY